MIRNLPWFPLGAWLRGIVHAVRLLVSASAVLLCVSAWGIEPDSETAPIEGVAAPNSAKPPVAPSVAAAESLSEESEGVVSDPIESPQMYDGERPPFDYDPYRVLIWVATDSPRLELADLEPSIRRHLDRDFRSLWRVSIAAAPAAIATASSRSIETMTFGSIAATDPVIAVKRDHKDVVRMKFAGDVGRYTQSILTTQTRADEVKSRLTESLDSPKNQWWKMVKIAEGDALSVREAWSDPATEAILVSRGIADELEEPKAKIIPPPITGQVSRAADEYDKIFVVNVSTQGTKIEVAATEFECLLRHFGAVSRASVARLSDVPTAVAWTVRSAFRPVVRIDDAGTRSAQGLIRAAGLIQDENSPARVIVGDVLEPMVRKNDRNGNPILIGPLDFAYLLVSELDGAKVEMDFHSGRIGGLQGRQNNRTFRMGVMVNSRDDHTKLRLHLKGNANEPLIGYEIYDKELDSKSMTQVGRTDWNGRLMIDPIDRPLRLLYVKNGGAVLARLPMVPGHHPKAIADLQGDDMRLQAEAYIRGVQNAVIDLVAIRELFKARIMMRLKRGDIDEAEELLEKLRNEPSNEKLANDMGKKQTMFLKAIGRNPGQQRKVDDLFSSTRTMLSKHINGALLRDLESAFLDAKKNGGKLPESPPDSDSQ